MNTCFYALFTGDANAVEMNWMDVPGEKLLEPGITMVSRQTGAMYLHVSKSFLFQTWNHFTIHCS